MHNIPKSFYFRRIATDNKLIYSKQLDYGLSLRHGTFLTQTQSTDVMAINIEGILLYNSHET